jgi:hypothetical protein
VTVLAAAVGQNDELSADRLGNRFDFGLADAALEKFQIAALYADHGKTRLAGAFAHVTALTDKNFSHVVPFLSYFVL